MLQFPVRILWLVDASRGYYGSFVCTKFIWKIWTQRSFLCKLDYLSDRSTASYFDWIIKCSFRFDFNNWIFLAWKNDSWALLRSWILLKKVKKVTRLDLLLDQCLIHLLYSKLLRICSERLVSSLSSWTYHGNSITVLLYPIHARIIMDSLSKGWFLNSSHHDGGTFKNEWIFWSSSYLQI